MSTNPASSSNRRSSDDHPFVAVKPYADYNDDLGLLSIATGPAFSEKSKDGHYTKYPAHMNHIKFAIRDAASKMSAREWTGVRNTEPRPHKILTDSMKGTYTFDRDRPDSPVQQPGDFQLSVYLTTERQPRDVPPGDHGLYEPTVPVSEAEMSNYPIVGLHVRSHHNGQEHYYDSIDITMDGTVRDKATRKIVALTPKAVQDLALGFSHMIPFIQDRLTTLTHMDKHDRETFLPALVKARKDVRSLADSTIHRLTHFDIDSNDVESVRPKESAQTWKSKVERTVNMKGLGVIPVTFIADYSRMGGDDSSNSTVRGSERDRR